MSISPSVAPRLAGRLAALGGRRVNALAIAQCSPIPVSCGVYNGPRAVHRIGSSCTLRCAQSPKL